MPKKLTTDEIEDRYRQMVKLSRKGMTYGQAIRKLPGKFGERKRFTVEQQADLEKRFAVRGKRVKPEDVERRVRIIVAGASSGYSLRNVLVATGMSDVMWRLASKAQQVAIRSAYKDCTGKPVPDAKIADHYLDLIAHGRSPMTQRDVMFNVLGSRYRVILRSFTNEQRRWLDLFFTNKRPRSTMDLIDRRIDEVLKHVGPDITFTRALVLSGYQFGQFKKATPEQMARLRSGFPILPRKSGGGRKPKSAEEVARLVAKMKEYLADGSTVKEAINGSRIGKSTYYGLPAEIKSDIRKLACTRAVPVDADTIVQRFTAIVGMIRRGKTKRQAIKETPQGAHTLYKLFSNEQRELIRKEIRLQVMKRGMDTGRTLLSIEDLIKNRFAEIMLPRNRLLPRSRALRKIGSAYKHFTSEQREAFDLRFKSRFQRK